MEELSSFENAVLTKLLAGDHPILRALRSQADRAELVSRTYTGAGFYCSFSLPPDVLPLEREPNFEIADVFGNIK